MIKQMLELLEAGNVFCIADEISTIMDKGEFRLLVGNEVIPDNQVKWVSPELTGNVKSLERTETSRIDKDHGKKEIFVDVYAPQPRLIAIGAVHIALPLTQMAQITGFSTIVIDPRKGFQHR